MRALLAAKEADAVVESLRQLRRQNFIPFSEETENVGEDSAFNKSLEGNFGPFRILDVEV